MSDIMKYLFSFFQLLFKYKTMILLSICLYTIVIISHIGLLSLSGWFISATALAYFFIIDARQFNYLSPATGIRFLALIRTIGRWFEKVIGHQITLRFLSEIRVLIFSKLVQLNKMDLAKYTKGELLNILINDINILDNLYLRCFLPFICFILSVVLLSVLVGYYDIYLGMTFFLFYGIFMMMLPVFFFYISKKNSMYLSDTIHHLRHVIIEYVSELTSLLVFNKYMEKKNNILLIEKKMNQLQKKINIYTSSVYAMVSLFNGALICGVIYFFWSAIGQHKPPESLLAAVVLGLFAMNELLTQLSVITIYLGYMMTSAKRLDSILSFPTQENNKSKEIILEQVYNLKIENLYFNYNNNREVLSDINIVIQRGEKVAVLGNIGAGKSTLLDCISGELPIRQGQIFLNNIDLAYFNQQELKKYICYIEQKVHIFNETLKENIRIANSQATDVQITQALKIVKLDYLLFENDGLEQKLGENGRELSGGEKRKISLVRAILHNAPVLLLDEPTEGLDENTEFQVMSEILKLDSTKIIIYITHKLTCIDLMDRVFYLRDGLLIKSE